MAFGFRAALTRLPRLILLAAVAMFIVIGIAGTVSVASVVLTDGGRAILQDAEPQRQVALVTASRADDAQPQDAAVRAAIADAFPPGTVDVRRRETVTVPAGDAHVTLLAAADIDTLADLVEGAWPGPGETAVLAAAVPRGLPGIGGVVDVRGERLTVVGTWRPKDAGSPDWANLGIVASGAQSGAIGPLVVGSDTFADIGSRPLVTWVIRPTHFDATTVDTLRAGLKTVREIPGLVDPGRTQTVQTKTDLSATLVRIADTTANAAGIVAVPLVVVACLGAIVLGVLMVSLAASRTDELQLQRARGASTVQIGRQAAAESGVVVGAGSLVGAAVVAVFVPSHPIVLSLATALVTTVIAVALAVFWTVRSSALTPARRSDGGLATLAVLALPFALVGAIATLAVLQLLARGSFLDQNGRPDLLAVAAPALVLVAATIIVPALSGPVLAIAERIARSGRGVYPVLPLRQLARRSRVVLASTLCLALAAGAATVGFAFATGTFEAAERATRTTLGADVRAQYDVPAALGDDVRTIDAAPVAALPGVESVSPTFRGAAEVAKDKITVLAGDTSFLPARLREELFRGGGIELAPDAALAVRGTQTPVEILPTPDDPFFDPVQPGVVPMTMVVTVWYQRADGVVARTQSPSLPMDGSVIPIDLSAAIGETLLAIDLAIPAGNGLDTGAYQVELTGAGGTEHFADDVAADGAKVRLSLTADAGDAVPVVVTRAFAERFDLHEGERFEAAVTRLGRRLDLLVRGVVPSLPGVGAGPAAYGDLDTMRRVSLSASGAVPVPNELWIRAADPTGVAEQVRAIALDPVTVDTRETVSDTPVLMRAAVVLAASLGVVALLAVLGFAAVTAGVDRERRVEAIPLRAIGLTPAAQRRGRAIEVTVSACFAIIAGALVGFAVVAALRPLLPGVLG